MAYCEYEIKRPDGKPPIECEGPPEWSVSVAGTYEAVIACDLHLSSVIRLGFSGEDRIQLDRLPS